MSRRIPPLRRIAARCIVTPIFVVALPFVVLGAVVGLGLLLIDGDSV